MYFIDYRHTLLYFYLTENKNINYDGIDTHVFDFLKSSTETLSTDELLTYKQNIVSMIPNKTTLSEKYDLSTFLINYRIIDSIFQNLLSSKYLNNGNYFTMLLHLILGI